jgi:hypothetical protein
MALKQCLDSAASKVGQKVKGRGGNMTYKGFFMSGLNIQQDLTLLNGEGPFTLDDAAMVTINSHANGQRGSAKRVKRRFPVFYDWHATADVYIFDDLLTPELVDEHVEIGGMLVGLGRFRPQNGGVNGRFRLVKSEWQDVRI